MMNRQWFKISGKLICLVALLFLSLSSSFGQDVELEWFNTESNVLGVHNDFKILKADEESIIYLSGPGEDFLYQTMSKISVKRYNQIVRYDLKNKTNTICDINFMADEVKLNKLAIVPVDDQVIVFSYFRNRKVNKFFMFAESYSIESMQSNNDIKKISEIDLSSLKDLKYKLDDLKIKYDNEKFVFRYICSVKEGDLYGLKVFDKQLNLQWESPVEPFVGGEYMLELDMKVDHEGDVFSVQRNYDKKRDVNNDYFESGNITVNYYPQVAGGPFIIPLKLEENKVVRHVQLDVKANNEMIGVGLYADKGSDLIKGYFTFVLDPLNLKVVEMKSNQFTPEFMAKDLDKRVAYASLKGLDLKSDFFYSSEPLHFRKDGGFDVVFQKYAHVTLFHNGGHGPDYYSNHRVFADNIVLSFNADGSPRWQQKVAKYTYGKDIEYQIGDYFLRYDEDENMQFIFNLNNLTGTNSSKVKDTKTVFIQLDTDGNETFQMVESRGWEAHQICPRYAFDKGDNTIVLYKHTMVDSYHKRIYSKKKNNLIFGELKIK